MKKNFLLLFLAFALFSYGQDGSPASPYYDNFNWSLTGINLKNSLSTKITSTHTNLIDYVWEATQATDIDPNNTNNVLLVYGFSNNTCPNNSSDGDNHRSRNINFNGGANSCEWNREHVYARALGTPPLDQTGVSDAGEDAHNLRASDVDKNGNRGNLKFATGNGNSGTVTGGWYPGDEWKGDVARMMMYMYLRYPTQCLPTNVGVGSSAGTPDDMIDLFLQWNAEDPVSEYEDNRNTYHGNTSNTYAQGNRNPFIDNPYLATLIWGGPTAQNRWSFLNSESFASINNVVIYPNPTSNGTFSISNATNLKAITIYNVNGQIVQEIKNPTLSNESYQITNLSSGFYLVQLASENGTTTKKVIVN